MFARLIVAFAAALCVTASWGQSHKPLYTYQGADRDSRVLGGAHREGELLVYTSLNLKDSVPIKEAFEKKYGIRLELWRSSSEKVLQRALTEARGGRYSVDAFELNGPEMEALRREGLWRSSGARSSDISGPRPCRSTGSGSRIASTSSPSRTTPTW